MQKLVLVVDDFGMSYYPPFKSFGPCATNPSILQTAPEKVGLVVFTGGSDVTPSFYGENCNDKTQCNPKRDEREAKVFNRARELELPIAGICRGSQFICAMSGGKLVQHLNRHNQYHDLLTDDGRRIFVSSTHHQMQLPPEGAVAVAWSDPRRSDIYEGPNGVTYEPDREHDVVYYPSTNALGMQYHPEYMDEASDGFRYCAELVERFFGVGKVMHEHEV